VPPVIRISSDLITWSAMTCATRFALAAAAALALATPRAAQADPPNAKATPVYVLSLSTEDSDDQADALTQALRSRVRQAHGWSISETTQSFDTLAIALKCPQRPDTGCLQRIGDQLHTDHFVWGTLSKGRAGEVKADIHMWSRGKPDSEATDTYSDNIKDPADEALRAIASVLFGKVSGSGAGGTLVVHAGNASGEVLVDGAPRGTLEGGVARIDVPVGSHTIAVRVRGYDASPQTANIAVNAESDVTITLTRAAPPPVEESPSSSFPARKVIEWSAIVIGAGLLVAGGVETAAWINDSNQSSTNRQQVPASIKDVCASQINTYAQKACQESKDAQTVSALGWTFGLAGAAVLGTGVILLLTDHGSSSESDQAADKTALHVVPSVGPRGGGVDLSLSF
jgi:hypothetical protein